MSVSSNLTHSFSLLILHLHLAIGNVLPTFWLDRRGGKKTKSPSFVSPPNNRVSMDQLQPGPALKAEFTGHISWKQEMVSASLTEAGHIGIRASFGPCSPGTHWVFPSFLGLRKKEKEIKKKKTLGYKTFDSTSSLSPERSDLVPGYTSSLISHHIWKKKNPFSLYRHDCGPGEWT